VKACLRWLLRFVPHLTVDSTSPMAIKLICRLVESGTPVVIFPEGRLAGIYPLKLLPKISITIRPRRTIPMPKLPSAKLRRRRAGELLRRILLDMLVATRPQRTLFEAFLDAKATFGARYRLVEDVRMQEESYGSLLRMSLGLARLLSSLTAKGEIVGVVAPNAAPTLGLVLGLSAAARIPALINYTAGADGIRAACVAAGIRTIVASRTFIEKARLSAVIEQLSDLHILYLEDLKQRLTLADKLWILWHQALPSSMKVKQSPDDPAIVLFTSGSEGKPKGVVHSHSSILSNVAQIRALADFTPLDKFMIALPLFHSFGLTCGVVMPLVSGCRVFLYPPPRTSRTRPRSVPTRRRERPSCCSPPRPRSPASCSALRRRAWAHPSWRYRAF